MSEAPKSTTARAAKLAANISMRSTIAQEMKQPKEEPMDDDDGTANRELFFCCSVDLCRKATAMSKMEFLPKDDVMKGIKMILVCKSSIIEQNFHIQKYLEAYHLANRSDLRTACDWNRRIPFRVCYRHFSHSKRLTMRLAMPMVATWKNYVDLIRREGLFYMHNVDLKVGYPFNTKGASRDGRITSELSCYIFGCKSNPILKDHTTGLPMIKLFPLPVEHTLHREWHNAIVEGHDRPFSFTLPATRALICEKHFPNGGKIVDGQMELPTLFDSDRVARETPPERRVVVQRPVGGGTQPPAHARRLSYGPIGMRALDFETEHCLVRCCPINSMSRKRNGTYFQMYEVPEGEWGGKWIKALRQADSHFSIKADTPLFVCERHFARSPDTTHTAIPLYSLTPSEATMAKHETIKDLLRKEEPCVCCKDVEMCQTILRRFNAKMNTLMQHVNMLCVLEGVKEVLPRPFNDGDDDLEMYGDTEKVAALADIRAASMFAQQAKGDLNAMSKAINAMGNFVPRRSCALLSCFSGRTKRPCRLVDADTFEDDLMSGDLLVRQESDRASVRRVLAKDGQVALCEKHWKNHIDNISVDFGEDSEDVKKLKEALALPLDFQPRFKKRRTEDLDDGGQGSSNVVKVEVNDDEEEDERLLSNNELLQRLLGGALAGQVAGEIGDNGEVYEGGEGEEMDELDNHEPRTEDEDEDDEEPPELD